MTTVTPADVYQANNLELAKAPRVRGDKSIYTYLAIPEDAKGPTGAEINYTHVKVYTMKHRNGVVSADSRAVEIKDDGTGIGSETFMLFGPDKFGTELYRETGRATEKTLLRVHTAGLTAIRDRFPELFMTPVAVAQAEEGMTAEQVEDRLMDMRANLD